MIWPIFFKKYTSAPGWRMNGIGTRGGGGERCIKEEAFL